MKFLKIRVLPLFLVVVLSVSFLVVPASAAADFPSEFRDHDAVADWNSKLLTSNSMGLNALAQATGLGATASEIFWGLVDGQVSNKAGEVNRSELEILASSYTAFFTSTIGNTFGDQLKNSFGDVFNDILARTLIGNWDPYFEVHQHPASGLYRIKEMTTGLFVVDSAGRYPYAEASSDGFLGTDQWIPISAMDGGSFRMVSKEALYNLADDVGGTAYTRGNYICIAKNASSGVVDKMVLANEDGKPYVCWKDKNQSATEQERPTTNVTENGNIVEGDDNSINLDLEGMTMLLPGGTLAFIDQIIYDESTKSYHIDSHDTYNYEINNYYTWNYYINYTSITYIGQTEEYNKYYEVYYELPDGRSSADLTKEDLEQLNLSVDVVPYIRSADDTSLRSLYHFDGDTKDSSYWNYCTDFTWNKGASLTYMEAGTFEGALYLDETEHDFTMTLPSNIGSGDFTLQFRYYQSATSAPQTDSYVKLGGNTVFQFNGGQFLNSSGSTLSSTPVGSWNEIAIIRSNGVVYYYLNGVCIGSAGFSGVLSDTINFHFGSSQQTFKYFDELRFLNFALKEGGVSYEPTSVPHDTNLTLVLPNSDVPLPDTYTALADEYWVFKNDTATNILTQYGLDDMQFHDSSRIIPISTLTKWASGTGFYNGAQLDSSRHAFPNFYYFSNMCEFKSTEGSSVNTYNTSIANKSIGIYLDKVYSQFSTDTYAQPTGGVHQFWGVINKNGQYYDNYAYGPSLDNSYTFSMVDMSGNIGSATFNPKSITYPTGYNATYYTTYFNGYYIGWVVTQLANLSGISNTSPTYGVWLSIQPETQNVANDFLYLELVEGSSTDLTAELETAIVPILKEDLNTPTLAVRTDVTITSHQIGGVRPSLPEKGMVWAMVENERITSLQVYNGRAWEGVDGRIWTGERWIPMSSYNIITLQDLYDIVDATPNYEYIYSEAGFWAWWQKSWNAFQEKLFQVLGSGGVGSSGASGGAGSSELGKIDLDSESVVSDPDLEAGKTLWQFIVLVVDGGKSVVAGTRELFSGVISTIPESMDKITDAFDPGGVAVGVLDGTSLDPDNPVESYSVNEGEVLDPWRYR